MDIKTLISRLKGLTKPKYRFKSTELQSISEEYMQAGDSLVELVAKLQGDGRLKKFTAESELSCVMDTEDFYKRLKGTSIVFEGDKFIIYDISSCGFPDYGSSRRYELTAENVERRFWDFTPQMFKAGMRRYIQTLDQVFYGHADPSQFDRKGRESPMDTLLKRICEKKEE